MLFILLAADMRIESVLALGWPGVIVVALLVVLVRPVSAWLSTGSAGLSARERTFIAWIAPRGIVAAAVSSLAALSLRQAGIEGGEQLLALVFLTIVLTVVLGGLTAAPVASWRWRLRRPLVA